MVHVQLKLWSYFLVSFLLIIISTVSLESKSTSWRSFPDIQFRDTGIKDDGRDDVRILFIPGFIHFLTRFKSELAFSHGPYLNHDLRERSDAIRHELETLCHHDSSFFPLQVCGQIMQLYDSRHFYHQDIFDGPILADIAAELAKSMEVKEADGIGDNVATWLHHLVSTADENHDVDVSVIHSKTSLQIGQHCSVLEEKEKLPNLCNLIMTAHATAFLHQDVFKMEGTFLSTIVNIIILGKMYGENEPAAKNWPTISPPTPTPSPTAVVTQAPTRSPTPIPPSISPTASISINHTITKRKYEDEYEDEEPHKGDTIHEQQSKNNKHRKNKNKKKERGEERGEKTNTQKELTQSPTSSPVALTKQQEKEEANEAGIYTMERPPANNFLHVRADVESFLGSKESERIEKQNIIVKCGKALGIPASRIQLTYLKPTFDYKGLDIMMVFLEEPGEETASSLRGRLKEQIFNKKSILRKEIPHLFVTELMTSSISPMKPFWIPIFMQLTILFLIHI